MIKAYPAIFHHEGGGYWVEFPDLPGCVTEADTVAEAVSEAASALGAFLCSMLDRGIAIPDPTDIHALSSENEDFLSVVSADPLAFKAPTRAVKKTLTIPAWLNEAAESQGVNFSQVLQEALKNILGFTGATRG